MWHETGHKTAFKSKFLNEFFYYVSSTWLTLNQLDGDTHTSFIMETLIQQKSFDHEIEYGNDLKETPKRLIINIIIFRFIFLKTYFFEIIQHALGIKTKVMQDSIPENAQAKAIFISRIYVAIWVLIILWSLLVSSDAFVIFCITTILWKNFT